MMVRGRRPVDLPDIVLYLLIGCMSAYVGTWAEMALDEIFYKPAIGTMFLWFMTYCAKLPLLFLASEFLNRALIGVFAADHYNCCHTHGGWFGSFNRLILPGEAVRFLFSLASLGDPDVTGAFCRVTAWVFEQDYLARMDRYAEVRELGNCRWQDIGAFAAVYLAYFAVHYVWNLWYYRKMWLQAEADYKRILKLGPGGGI